MSMDVTHVAPLNGAWATIIIDSGSNELIEYIKEIMVAAGFRHEGLHDFGENAIMVFTLDVHKEES